MRILPVLLAALLGATLVPPAHAGLPKCAAASPSTPENPCKATRSAATGRLVRVALIEHDVPWSRPLTEAEAHESLDIFEKSLGQL